MIDGFADSLLLGLVFLAVAVALCAWPDEHSRGRYQPANGHRRGNRVAESAARMARWAIGKTLRPAAGRTGERGRPLASPLRPAAQAAAPARRSTRRSRSSSSNGFDI